MFRIFNPYMVRLSIPVYIPLLILVCVTLKQYIFTFYPAGGTIFHLPKCVKYTVPWKWRDDKIYKHLPSRRACFRVSATG